MINNNICMNCDHSLVCEIAKKKLFLFSEDNKTQLGVDIKIESCTNFRDVEEAK
jgi:hypothetical protein